MQTALIGLESPRREAANLADALHTFTTERLTNDAITTAFTSASTQAVMRQACQETGLSADDAEPMRFGENALFHLKSEAVVVRIAPAPWTTGTTWLAK